MNLDDIADQRTLWHAFGLAARGKQGRADVVAFRRDLHANLNRLGAEIRFGEVVPQKMRCFTIRDPKPRVIHAPTFRDRVLHHSIMLHAGPVLDRTLIDDSFACRTGKGAIAAVTRARQFTRRSRWYARIDIASYFPSISHDLLMMHLASKFRDRGLLSLIERIVTSHSDGPGRGLPIGALTSQHFANCFLGSIDRLIQQHPGVTGYVRYMDDMVWWTRTEDEAINVLNAVTPALGSIELVLKEPVVCRSVRDGLRFCGFRILPQAVYPSSRRRRRFAAAVLDAETRYIVEHGSETLLQRDVDPVLATLAHCASRQWRSGQLARMPLARESDAA